VLASLEVARPAGIEPAT